MFTFTHKLGQLAKGLHVCQKSLPVLSLARNLTSSTSGVKLVQFDFIVSKFNDVHVKHESITKFSEKTNQSAESFELALKGKSP